MFKQWFHWIIEQVINSFVIAIKYFMDLVTQKSCDKTRDGFNTDATQRSFCVDEPQHTRPSICK